MSLVINSNISSLTAQRSLTQTGNALSNAMERLSTGLRINSARDDAAGLAITDRMTSQIRGLNQAVRNANDGISMAQTAEGALQESTNILQRMRELAVQAVNDTNSADDRASIQTEVDALALELTRIADTTSFNGKVLLDGSEATALNIQVGANQNQTMTIDLSPVMTATGLGVNALDVATDAASAGAAITAVDAAILLVDNHRSDLGAVQNRLSSTVSNLQNVSENQAAARSRILDADFAQETAALSKNQILQQAGTAMLAQANQSQQGVLSLLR